MKFFQPGVRLFGHGGTLAAEVVQLLHLAKELHRVVHAVNAELEFLDVVSANRDFGLLAGEIGALAGDGEIGFGVGVVLGKEGQDEKLKHEDCQDRSFQVPTDAQPPRRSQEG